MEILKGVPQGSVLGALLFTIFINSIDYDTQDVNIHFYADDTIVYCSAPSCQLALSKLLWNHSVMAFQFKTCSEHWKKLNIWYSRAQRNLKLIWLLSRPVDDALSFGSRITQLKNMLKIKRGFYFRNKLCLSFNAQKKLSLCNILTCNWFLWRCVPICTFISPHYSRCRLSWFFKVYSKL